MDSIDSFLQKRKMREHHYGIVMIITAYILSMLMLLLGSDVINEVKYTAAEMEKTEEETEKSDTGTRPLLNNSYNAYKAYVLKKQLINPYNVGDITENTKTVSSADDMQHGINTFWFLGTEMNDHQFDSLMLEAGGVFQELAQKKASLDKSQKGSDKSEEAVKTEKADSKKTVYKVKVASYNKTVTVTEEEVKMLERITQAEAGGEDEIGKILVVNVILNRAASDKFPDTIKQVIFQKNDDGDYQFSPVKSGKYWKVKVTKETKEAVRKALKGEDYSRGALYFMARKYAKSQNAKWFDEKLELLFKHGAHEFFK